MTTQYVIALVGIAPETGRELRRHFETLHPRLRAGWTFGPEHQADLLIVDPTTMSGQMARSLAQFTGQRYAELRPRGLDEGAAQVPVLNLPLNARALSNLLECAVQALSFDTGFTIDDVTWLNAARVEPPPSAPELVKRADEKSRKK